LWQNLGRMGFDPCKPNFLQDLGETHTKEIVSAMSPKTWEFLYTVRSHAWKQKKL